MTSLLSARAYNFYMKGLAAAALAVAIALPACAQHGGGGGGGHASSGGHGAPAARPAPAFHGTMAPSHGTFAPSMPYHYSSGYPGGAIAHAPIPYPSSIRLMSPGVRYPGTAPINRPNFYHPGHGTNTHGFIIRSYPAYPYAYPSYVYGSFPSDLGDDSYGSYDNSQQPSEQQPDNGYALVPQPDNGYPPPDDGYAYPQPMPASPGYPQPAPDGAYAYPAPPPGYEAYPQPAPVAPQMQYVPGSAATVILIYKDGRPPEQIQNYLATRSTLTVLDGGRRREVPLSDLNIPATISANRQTGVDFQLPTSAP